VVSEAARRIWQLSKARTAKKKGQGYEWLGPSGSGGDVSRVSILYHELTSYVKH
jgi:hypothetical protein